MELPKDFENVIIKIKDYDDKDVAKIITRGGKICEGKLSGCWVDDIDGTDDTTVYEINLDKPEDEKYTSILKEIREKIIDSYKHKGAKDLTLIELMDILDEYLPEKETMKWQMQNCCCIWDKEAKI